MSELISRSAESEIYPIDGEALFNAVQNLKRYDIRRNMFEEIALMHVFKDQDVLNTILSAERLDVEPVIHATWIEDGYRGIPCVCSHCGEEAHYTSTFREQFDYDWEENLVPCGHEEIREYIRSNRCPNCGARMDGDADG